MTDDPIFDPWAIGGKARPYPEEERAGERVVGDAEAATPEDPSSVTMDSPAPRRWVIPAAPIAKPESTVSVPGPESDRAIDRRPPRFDRLPRQTGGLPTPRPQPLPLRALQGVALPRLEELRARLEVSGHRAVLYDRSDGQPPTLRLRFVPRRGAFDEPGTDEGTVLEFTWDEEAAHVSARFWLDPLAEEWSEEVTAPPSRVDQAWADRVIVEFVSRALRALA